MKEKGKNTPIVRFKGFCDDWEQRKVSDVAERYDNLRVPVAASLRKAGSTPYYGANGIQDYVDGFTHNGEFILVAEDGANNLKNYPIKYVNGRIWVNNHAHVLQGKISEADTRFLGYSISQADIESVLVGGGRAKLNADVLMNIELMMPEKSEQQKISSFFASLDKTIALHQRQLDEQKALKKYFLQNMFPAKGEKVPRIRFQGFTGDWEERKLGDVITEFYNGQTPYRRNKTYWNGNVNWLSSSDLNRGVVTRTLEKITEEGRGGAGLRVVPKGTLVIAIMGLEAAGTRGNCGILGIDTTINQACMALIVDEKNISSCFLFQWYKRFGNTYALKFTQGTKQQNYNAELLANLEISYPKMEEQIKIGEYFRKVDHLIAFHQRQLTQLQAVKKFMLQNLFV